MRRQRDRSPIPPDAVRHILTEGGKHTAKSVATVARTRLMGPPSPNENDVQHVTRIIRNLAAEGRVVPVGKVSTDERGGRPAVQWEWNGEDAQVVRPDA